MFAFKKLEIDQWIEEIASMDNALLIDVRSRSEYREGRIPGSINLPLDDLDSMDEIAEKMDAPIFVYCRSGARSTAAEQELQDMGYTNVKNIGGIANYTGEIEK